MSKIKVDKKEYEVFRKWKEAHVSGNKQLKKKSHKFRNYFLLLIVILVVWFILNKNSFIAFWNWVFSLF